MPNEVDKLRDRVNQAAKAGPEQIQPMMVREAATFKLTAGELLAACKETPSHPNAAIFTKAAEGLPESYPLVVERLDLEAMLNNQEVETVTTVEDSGEGGKARVVRKRLKGSPAPAKPKASKPKEDK